MTRPPRKIGLVLPSVMASGTERRMAFVYRHLEARWPGEYRLVVSRELYATLNRGGFGLDRLPGVRVLGPRFGLDRKTGAYASWVVNLGRVVTLWRYRNQVSRWLASERAAAIHAYLEMVPFLGLAPLPGAPMVTAVVDHHPKYFDGRSLDARLLRRAIDSSVQVDCLYAWMVDRLASAGVPRSRLHHPAWNCVNHEMFHPEPKAPIVTYSSRTIDIKNPMLVVEVAHRVVREVPGVHFYLLGKGTSLSSLRKQVRLQGLEASVTADYLEDPSPLINRSLIHLSLEELDNSTNQTLLEGMAAGCASIASEVGETARVVTEEVGALTSLEPEAIAREVVGLLKNPDRAQALGRAGRKRVLENHGVDRYLEYLRSVHELV